VCCSSQQIKQYRQQTMPQLKDKILLLGGTVRGLKSKDQYMLAYHALVATPSPDADDAEAAGVQLSPCADAAMAADDGLAPAPASLPR
jgi:hypothetical protein